MRMFGSSGKSVRSRAEICCGDHRCRSRRSTSRRSARHDRSLGILGRYAARTELASARQARYCPRPPLTATSRDTVEGDRPRSFAIDRQDSPACMPLDISSRSVVDNRSAERGLLPDFRPPDRASSRCTDFDEQPMTTAASECVCPERMRACRRPRSSGVSRSAGPDP